MQPWRTRGSITRWLLETIALVRRELKAAKSVAQMRQEHILRAWESWGELIPNLNPDYWIAVVSASYVGERAAVVQPWCTGGHRWCRSGS